MNNQDLKKFKFMEITGTETMQCDHVMIMSVVDLHFGERLELSQLDYHYHNPLIFL